MSRHNAVDYLFSGDNVIYSVWIPHFVWWPVKTITGRRIWLKYCYRRERRLLNDIPQFPVNALNKIQSDAWEELVERKLQGLP